MPIEGLDAAAASGLCGPPGGATSIPADVFAAATAPECIMSPGTPSPACMQAQTDFLAALGCTTECLAELEAISVCATTPAGMCAATAAPPCAGDSGAGAAPAGGGAMAMDMAMGMAMGDGAMGMAMGMAMGGGAMGNATMAPAAGGDAPAAGSAAAMADAITAMAGMAMAGMLPVSTGEPGAPLPKPLQAFWRSVFCGNRCFGDRYLWRTVSCVPPATGCRLHRALFQFLLPAKLYRCSTTEAPKRVTAEVSVQTCAAQVPR